MSLDPAIFRAMVVQGASPEMLLAVVDAAAAVDEARKEKKRANNAERQARHRAKNNANNALPRVTERDTPFLDKERSPRPPKEIKPIPELSEAEASSPALQPEPLIEIELSGEPPLSPEEILEAWNDTAGPLGLPKAKMTPGRRRKALTLIRQHGISDFTEAIDAIRRSPFLRGENGRSWRADFDFFLQPTSFTRMIEGSYDRAN